MKSVLSLFLLFCMVTLSIFADSPARQPTANPQVTQPGDVQKPDQGDSNEGSDEDDFDDEDEQDSDDQEDDRE
jgi:hypothetical protein